MITRFERTNQGAEMNKQQADELKRLAQEFAYADSGHDQAAHFSSQAANAKKALHNYIDSLTQDAQQPVAWMTEAQIDEYIDDYEMIGEDVDGRDACHVPTADEKALIKDAIMGLTALPQPVQAEIADLTQKLEDAKADTLELEGQRDRLTDILKRTAIALKGPEPELTRWSWHDLPELAEDARKDAELYQREAEIRYHEREHARARMDKCVAILTGIHALLYPPRFTDDTGVTLQFHSPHVHEQMQALSDRIKAIPDEIDAATHSEG